MKKTLKRSLSFVLALTIVFGSALIGLGEIDFSAGFGIGAKAEGVYPLTFELNEDTNSYSVRASNTDISGAVDIPATYNELPVTAIADSGFAYCEQITSVSIPENVTHIDRHAFLSCSNLKAVSVPQGVTEIDDHAFMYCKNLESINIPDGVTRIGQTAFQDCVKLNSIVLPDSVNFIDIQAFYNTGFYNNTANWYQNALYSGKCLIEVKSSVTGKFTIKNGTRVIGTHAFASGLSASGVTSVVIPDSVVYVNENAFYNCKELKSVDMSDNLTYIGNYAFNYCKALISIKLPNTLKHLGYSVFSNCSALTSVEIPEGITYLDEFTFVRCPSLKSVVLPSTITEIKYCAFGGCDSLENIYFNGTSKQWAKVSIGEDNKPLLDAKKVFTDTKPATPKVETTNEIGGVQVTWNKVAGATKYVVFRRQGGYSTWVNVGTTTGNTLLDKNVKSGIFYIYSVRAYNSAGKYSDFVSANTNTRKFMATPKLTTIYNHVNGLAIKWNAVAGITKGYRVYRRGAGQTTWTYLGTTKNLYFIDNAVKNKSGEYFRYTVIADGGYHSKFDTTGLYLRRLANPTLTSAVSSKSGITVKWGAVKGTTGYYVYRKTANSTWTRVGTVGGTNNTTFLDKTAKKGTTYTYTVKAVYGATTSGYYSGISCKDKY